MDFTGERFIPGAGLDGELVIEHYQRYQAAVELIAGKVVLDAAAGEGYGSAILAERAARVYGLEIDARAVAEAKSKYRQTNLHFIQGTIAHLPFPSASLEAVTSFETIEHVPAELQEAFLGEIKRVLKPGGILLISTPDKRLYSDLPGYRNEFHLREFYRDEFHAFLSRHFASIRFWEQTATLAYVLTDSHETHLSQPNPCADLQGKYIVALCSDAPLPDARLGTVTLDQENLFQKKAQRVVELQDEIEEKNRHIEIVLRDISVCENTIRAQEQTIQTTQDQAEQTISSLHTEIASCQQRTAALEAALRDATAALNHIQHTKAWRLIKKLYRLKDTLCRRS